MKLTRDVTWKIRFVIDEFIPPIIRDSNIFSLLVFKMLYKLLYGNKGDIFLTFKQKASRVSLKRFSQIYESVNAIESRHTDLNAGCERELLKNVVGKTVLEVGCGKGYLSKKMATKYRVFACDIVIDRQMLKNGQKLSFFEANVEKLPWGNREFDTVVCTHTLEHVQNLFTAIKELRRVTRRRLMIVVPKQRPYKYTFDLHLHFFPYDFSLTNIMKDGQIGKSRTFDIDGDLLYIEDLQESS